MRSVALVVVLAGLAAAARGDACTTTGGIALMDPPMGATGVSTDVELWLAGGVTSPAREPALTDPDGVDVPFTVRPLEGGSWRFSHFLLRPDAPLRPRTRYTFRDRRPALPDVVWTFETSDGPSQEPPAALRIDASQAVYNGLRSSCGYESLACVGLSYRGVVDVTFRRRCDGVIFDRYLARTDSEGLWLPFQVEAIREPFCAELRARWADGALGPAATFCTDPATTPFVIAGCEFTCRGGRAFLDGTAVEPHPNDRTPDQCLMRGFLSQERWAEARAPIDARRAEAAGACTQPDGGGVPSADVVTADAPTSEATDAGVGDDAAPPTGSVVVAGCGCRAGGDGRASGWWALALVALRRRKSRR